MLPAKRYFAKEIYALGANPTFCANCHVRGINFFGNLRKMTLVNSKTIVFDENLDFNLKMHIKDRGVFFSEGFASPKGPGPGPASQERPRPGP